MWEVSVMWGMKSGTLVEGKRDGIEVLMRDWRAVVRGEVEGGSSQRDEPGIVLFWLLSRSRCGRWRCVR